jgi:PAS domain S-box-containing protein
MQSAGLRLVAKPRTPLKVRRSPPGNPRRRAETHLLDAQSVAQVGSWEIDLATGTLSITPELRRMLGCGWDGEPELAWICDAAHPSDRARVEAWLGRSQGGTAHGMECFFRLVKSDGTIGTFHGKRALRLGHRGQPARLCGTIQDVTEQVASDRAINEAAHLYRDIFENCPWGLFQTTADGRYVTANPALARIYGYQSPSELMGRLTDIGGQLYVERDRRAAFVATMKERGVVHGFESQVYRRDGSIIWITETCREVRASTGRLLYYEGTVDDISERKRNEKALTRAIEEAEAAKRDVEAANLELERRVVERTSELRTAQSELLRKERLSTLGKVTATVAHELRNPLSAIRNSMYALGELSPSADEAYQRPLSRIERCVSRCETIIADLIEYSHVRALRCRTTVLDDWLRDFFAGHDVADTVSLELCLGAGDAAVALDRERMKRVMVSLLDNAVQAFADAPEGSERRIRVSTDAGAEARIVIADTGPGIPAAVLPNVFDPLFSTKSFGTGLGLPTVRQAVEQHGGKVALTSKLGSGTDVEIRLPRV